MNPMEKQIIERNTTSYNVSFLVDNKNCPFQYEKLHPLIDRKGKLVSETMYRDIEKIIQQDSLRYVTPDANEGFQLKNQQIVR